MCVDGETTFPDSLQQSLAFSSPQWLSQKLDYFFFLLMHTLEIPMMKFLFLSFTEEAFFFFPDISID